MVSLGGWVETREGWRAQKCMEPPGAWAERKVWGTILTFDRISESSTALDLVWKWRKGMEHTRPMEGQIDYAS